MSLREASTVMFKNMSEHLHVVTLTNDLGSFQTSMIELFCENN